MGRQKRLLGPGGSGDFIAVPGPRPDRQAILRLGQRLIGPTFVNPNFVETLSRESDLAWTMSRRVDATVAKFMHAIAQSYVEGASNPLLLVEGAKLQQGTGNSRLVKRDGKNFLAGTEAAHFGIGTFARHGEAVSVRGARQLEELAGARGVPFVELREQFQANLELARVGLVYDALTYLAPAFINRAEGLLETHKQQFMNALSPTWLPDRPEQLERFLVDQSQRLVSLLASTPRVVLQPIDERLRSLNAGGAREFLQDPADAPNVLFGGTERELLAVLRDLHAGAGSPFHSFLEQVLREIPEEASRFAETADAARQEREGE